MQAIVVDDIIRVWCRSGDQLHGSLGRSIVLIRACREVPGSTALSNRSNMKSVSV